MDFLHIYKVLTVLLMQGLYIVSPSAFGVDQISGKNSQVYYYQSLLDPDYKAIFIKDSHGDNTIWGDLGAFGFDVSGQIENCASSEKEFCLQIPGLFQFHYTCNALGMGHVWEKDGWTYTINKLASTDVDYFIEAKGKVFLSELTDVSWNFILSKSKGVVSLLKVEPVGSHGEMRAKLVWRVIGEGFGNIDQVCRD